VKVYSGLFECTLSEDHRNAWIRTFPSATSAIVNISVAITGLKTGLCLEKPVTELLG
jgi:hypothetical protein